MNASHGQLPPGFEGLEPFAAHWAADSAAQRDRLRAESSEADRAAFYDAVVPRIQPALELLDQKSFADFDAREQCLMNLMLCFAHVSIAVEIQRDLEEQRARARRHLRITRSSADL
jgi:hypothetical protein